MSPFMNCENKIYNHPGLQGQPQELPEAVEQCCKENVNLVRKVFFSQVHLNVQIVAKKKHKERAKQALYATLFKLV